MREHGARRLRASIRDGLANGGDNLRITCQSSMDKLPGNCCSKPERHGGLGEEGSWIGLGCFNHRLSTFLRPDFGEVFQEGLAEYRAAAERSATRPHTTIHMFGWLKSHFFCFLLLIRG